MSVLRAFPSGVMSVEPSRSGAADPMAIPYEELTPRNVAGLLPPDDLHSEMKIRHGNSLLDPQGPDDYGDSAAAAPPQPGT